MTSTTRRLPAITALALASLAWPSLAGSLGASSAAGGSSASSASSASSEASSDSSSRGQRAAAGPYRIIAITEVAALADQPAQARLQLQALAADAPEPQHVLLLPRAVVLQHGLAAGQTISARPQAYGTEFVQGGSQQAFHLELSHGWQRELPAQPVRL